MLGGGGCIESCQKLISWRSAAAHALALCQRGFGRCENPILLGHEKYAGQEHNHAPLHKLMGNAQAINGYRQHQPIGRIAEAVERQMTFRSS